MVVLGILALCQMTFLPGVAVLRLCGFQARSGLQRLTYAFASSLIINFFLIRFLSAAGLYNRAVLLGLIIAELAYLAVACRRPSLSVTLPLSPLSEEGSTSRGTLLANLCCQTLALATVFVYAYIWWLDVGSVFTLWDDVVSWDRWAMEWYSSGAPTADLYPQLVPSNWSIAYQLLQNTDVKLFHKALMPLFPLATILTLVDFSRFRAIGTSAACLGALVYGAVLQYLFDVPFIVSGYVDIASAFFGILTLYAWTEAIEPAGDVSRLIFPAVFAAATLMTKQGGIYIFALALLWLAVALYRCGRSGHRKAIAALLVSFAIAFVLSFPLLTAELRIIAGKGNSNLPHLTERLHGGRSIVQRWEHAYQMLATARGLDFRFVLPSVIVALCFSTLHSFGRKVLFGIALPFYCFWALLFSYERRTAAIVLPFLSLCAGLGVVACVRLILESGGDFVRVVQQWPRPAKALIATLAGASFVALGVWMLVPLESGVLLSPLLRAIRNMWYGHWLETTKWMWLGSLLPASILVAIAFLRKGCVELRLNPWTAALVVLIMTGMLKAHGFSDERLVRSQLELQRSVGYKSLNQKLYNLLQNGNLRGQIASEYWHVGALPELKKQSVLQAFPPGFSYEWAEALRKRDPEIRFLLFSQEHWADSVKARMLSQGYSLLAVDTGFCLVGVPEDGPR